MKDNDDINGEPLETEDKVETEPVQRPRKTSKFMTKYERARILGTRALQIRSASALVLLLLLHCLSQVIELDSLCCYFFWADTA